MVLDKIVDYTEKDGDVLIDGNDGIEINVRIREFKGHTTFLKFHNEGESALEENDLDITDNDTLSTYYGVANPTELKTAVIGTLGFAELSIDDTQAIALILADIKTAGYYIVIR